MTTKKEYELPVVSGQLPVSIGHWQLATDNLPLRALRGFVVNFLVPDFEIRIARSAFQPQVDSS